MRNRQAYPYKLVSEKQTTKNFCEMASSENHEKHECRKTNGQTVGSEFGVYDHGAKSFVDWLIHNWVTEKK